MPTLMIAAVALLSVGACASSFAYARAPDSQEFSLWDFTLVGGISLSALGVLAGLVEMMTG